MPAHILLNALKESVLRRTSLYTIYQVGNLIGTGYKFCMHVTDDMYSMIFGQHGDCI